MDQQPQPPIPPQPPTGVPPQPPQQPQAPQQPVAYDAEGRPLYAAPPQPVQQQPTQVPPPIVHMTRAVEPIEQPVPPEIKAKHEESMKRYPFLNLSAGEYVISAIRRHPIGLILPIAMTIFFVALTASVMINFSIMAPAFGLLDPVDPAAIFFYGMLLIGLFLIGGYIAVWVYLSNKFFLTNESVIQEIQTSLFSRHEQTVSLANIEDASFQQHGIIQNLFNYGSIRLSTEGDETTYRFSYVTDPKNQIAILNNAVESFKMGRPVSED